MTIEKISTSDFDTSTQAFSSLHVM